MEDLLNFDNSIYGLLRVIVIVVTFLAFVARIREFFSDQRRRQTLKLDIDILNSVEEMESIESKSIMNKVKREIEEIYDEESVRGSRFGDFLLGITIFVGFLLWTINIYAESESFNPWSILTMIISGSGFSMAVGHDTKTKRKGEFFRIEFHDKSNFAVFVILGVVALISLVSMIYLNNEFSWWMVLFGVFVLLGLSAAFRSMKFKRVKTQT